MRLITRALVAMLLPLVGGCALILDFSEEGLACDPDGRCLEGYVCNGQNQCMAEGHPSTLCTGCGPLETCFRSRCEPVCNNRACAAGQSCVQGVCEDSAPRTLGAECTSDADCESPGTCLLPYGGGLGVCTRTCTSNSECSNNAPECVRFENGGTGVYICANPSFKPCEAEADCVPSGLSCGVYALTGSTVDAVMACRARNEGTGTVSVGQACTPAIPCANGLCVRVNGSGQTMCTATCSTGADCEGLFPGQGHACGQVLIESASFPATRPKLCVPDGLSMLLSCSASAATCHADAPYCKSTTGNPNDAKCLAGCSDHRTECIPGVAAACETIDGDAVCRP